MQKYIVKSLLSSLFLFNLLFTEETIEVQFDFDYTHDYNIGKFIVRFDSLRSSFTIFNKNNINHIIWKSLDNKAFLTGSKAKESVNEDHGSFFIKDKINQVFNYQLVDKISIYSDTMYIDGFLQNKNKSLKAPYRFIFSAINDFQISFRAEIDSSYCNRSSLHYISDNDEYIYGFGEQFTNFNLKGKTVPIFVSEQGIGRGKQPITFLIDLVANSGGNEFTSYAPIPHYISSKRNSIYLKNLEYSVFDFSSFNSASISVFSNIINGAIIHSENPLDIINEYTEFSGKMKPLPSWSQHGAIIGLQGGTDRVGQIVDSLLGKGVPISGVWLQDWVGQRVTEFGKQLWWNWELDKNHYPKWDSLLTSLHDKNIKVLTYINPFLTDVSNKNNFGTNYYKIAQDSSYFVVDSLGIPFDLDITTFSASLIDLTNPAAKNWFKKIIEKNMLSLDVDGWMADFGEALPYYSNLYSGNLGSAFHNYYPVMWAQLNSEIVENSFKKDELLYFCRSGYTQSPRSTSLFWLGDQLVTWDNYDGIKTAITGLLSSGLSGFSLNHSDIGGYTSIKTPFLKYIRSKELFMRWAEINAFTSFFRTHEGNRPEDNHQVYSDEETMIHFSKMAKIYSSLAFYREILMQESYERGSPIVRHPFLHYPEDKEVLNIKNEQFMLGSEFMICPILDEKREEATCYLPMGNWVHLWSLNEYNFVDKGEKIKINSPIGMPAVFYKKDSDIAKMFLSNLKNMRILD